MKRIVIASALLLVLIYGCSSTQNYVGIVKYTGSSDGSVMKVTTEEYGASEDDAKRKSEIRAFEQLLFYGVPNSPISEPMIKAQNAKEENKDYFQNLFENKGYEMFLTCNDNLSVKQIDKKIYKAVQECCISYQLLRMDLEKNGIIKKLGF